MATASDQAPAPGDGERWWPSPFGADDELGMLNHVADEKRRAAVALAREGRFYDLGRVLDERIPVLGGGAWTSPIARV